VEIIPATATSIENAYQNILDGKVKFRYVNAASNVGVTPIEIKEVLYQSVPYVSISKVIDFINVANEIFTERNILLPLESQSFGS
jgi:alkylhydroperoxidase/carboxymuconolactone decarboxylase family protein YurZ